MDYSFEIKNSKNEKVAFRTITSTTKSGILKEASEYVKRNPQITGCGYTCTITSFDWQRGSRICGRYNL